MARVLNFSAGPATLPEEVLKEAQSELVDYKGSGMSLMEASHRGKEYDAVHQEAVANVTELLNLSDDYAVLFLQGGASSQFAMVPMNLVKEGQVADYTNSGSWAKKAIAEAKILECCHIAADASGEKPARMPRQDELDLAAGSAYLHITSNETIGGIQWKTFPKVDLPLVADMSSDILSRPFDMNPFGLVYAGAQKNLGPSGVTLVIIRKDLAEGVSGKVPTMLRYKTHIEADSLYNTPPTFGIYILMLVTRWIKVKGGLNAMAEINVRKAAKLYAAIDATDFFSGTAAVEDRSDMNVTFRLPSEELETKFIAEAGANGMKGLKGHRSVGGVRASIYNAFPEEGIDTLVEFMKTFEAENG
ncbi:MAG: 3-phosphoserine/phosphohydroxythreonine transaminase [Verrucomicrobia bacterium]|nr:3-phosphoserine/phosphohydroxythreonine transaminase [Verrucomicrobiota bacterium]